MKQQLYLILLLIFTISCDQDNKDHLIEESNLDWTNLDLSKDFEVGSRNELGIDTDQLNEGIEEAKKLNDFYAMAIICLLYTSPSPRDLSTSRMPSSA